MTDKEVVITSNQIDVNFSEAQDINVTVTENPINVTLETGSNQVNVSIYPEQPIEVTLGGLGNAYFTDLLDTPSNYTGHGGKAVYVNEAENGLVFQDAVSSDELVKYNTSDSSAGYLADKVIAGTGISLAENNDRLQITNNDLGSSAVSTHESTYNHSLISTALQNLSGLTTDDLTEGSTNLYDQTVTLSAGTGISTSGTYPNFTITNSSPDQVVSITGGTNVTITGTYPNFAISDSSINSSALNSYLTTTSANATYVPQARTLTINGDTYDLSANRSWTITATTPGGSNQQLQYNDNGSLGGISLSKWNKNTNRLGLFMGALEDPSQRLDINGKVQIGDDANTPTEGTIRWNGSNFQGYDGSNWLDLDVQSTSGGGWTEDTINNLVYLSNSGRDVGIGTNSPEKKLDVRGSSYFQGAMRIGDVTADDYDASQMLHVTGKIQIGNDSNPATAGTIRYSGGVFEGYDGSQWKALDVQSTSGGGWTEDEGNDIIYTSNLTRNVGIGVSDPGAFKLNVNGDQKTDGDILARGIYLHSSATSVPAGTQLLEVSGKIRVGDDGVSPTAGTIRFLGGYFQGYDGTNWKELDAQPGAGSGGWTEDDNYIYVTSGTKNVGIGTSYPSSRLHVVGSAVITGYLGVGTTNPSTNLEVNGFVKIGTSNQSPTAGVIRWNGSNFQGYDGSGWVNLDSAGGSGGGGWIEDTINNTIYQETVGRNVGIGTQTPSQKLQVSGNLLATNIGIGVMGTGVRRLHIGGDPNGGMTLTPTNLPGTPIAGDIIIDSANSNTLKWYNGSTWISAGVNPTFLNLTDTPSSYTDQEGKVVAVKSDGSGLEFVSSGGIGTDQRVKISSDDTTEGFLEDKLSAGSDITFTQYNTGGNEYISISVNANNFARINGSNQPFTGRIGVNNRVWMDSSNVDESEISANAYYSGSNWYRNDTSKKAIKLRFLADTGNAAVGFFVANEGSNPISSWTQKFQVNELGDLYAVGNIYSANVTGSVVHGTKVTTIGSPGSDDNIPTEQAVREALSSAGYGDISGPTSSTDGHVVLFNGETGKIIKSSNTAFSSLALASNVAALTGATFTGPISATNLSGTNTGDQTITLTGDVSGSGTTSFNTTIVNNSINTAKITDGAVSFAKLTDASQQGVIIGRYSTGSGDFQEIVLGSNLSLSGNTLNAEGGAGTAIWGGISGTITDQTDLNTQLTLAKKTTLTLGVRNGNLVNTGSYSTKLIIPRDISPQKWYLVADNSCTLEVDLWARNLAIPTSSAYSICGTELPSLTSSQISSDTNLTTWENLNTGDVLVMNVNNAVGCSGFTLVIEGENT